ncbi:uncharacterized protein PV06_04126 [Exophiala oligosperma]|uniref:Uncharacterized protein n=1 Tax=Exophiala oligosperma TaxID=215243 RepID=A0A0D2DTB9_9EURO|nr:uncharacterized protein PV06_04126 [Exophiala oligosperma]KIW45770.1 hypothetical protein PV06_04126 [Exophiala oligosperma]
MCYYARIDFACVDWKWGNMKQRCPRQHRIGETCGARLADPDNIDRDGEQCRVCKEIEVKQRRKQKELDNIARWRREGNNFTASIEKAEREALQLQETIDELQNRRASIKSQLIGDARLPTLSR